MSLSVKNVSRDPLNVPPERLMERFVRGEESRTTEGSGLGLSIAKWIIDRHGGWFEVVSREGVGTRISFLLPADQTPPAEEAAG